MELPIKSSSSQKKNFLIKTWERCRSISSGGGAESKKKVAPEGFFPVYVGPEKRWFALKMEYANHPLFKMLLEDAENEYGYTPPRLILLPCDVDLFCRVVAEMEAEEMQPHGCGFGFKPSRRLVNTGGEQMGKGYGGFGVLKPSSLLVKIN